MKRAFLALTAIVASFGAQARIEAPDHVIYGTATVFGNPAAPGQQIEARLLGSGELLAAYKLGESERLGDQFALRIPMDAVDPRLDGRARPGDPIQIYLGGELAGETTVGKEGRAVRLDIDPQNLGEGPSIAVTDVELFEGNAGTSAAVFDVTMNTTSENDVTVSWATADETATGGAGCSTGVDYVSSDSALTILPGELQASITVLICGDTTIEGTETFVLNLQAQRGVLEQSAVTGTIIGDDDVPTLLLADVVVVEPNAGQTGTATFVPTLSSNSDFESRFNYSVQPLNAVAGVDYQAVSGTATIAAGEIDTEVSVPILHSPAVTDPRSFRLVVSQPFNVLLDDTDALGVIQDPDFEPAVEPQQELVNQEQNITSLSGPTALAEAPGGAHVYVSSESLDAVVAFSRNATSGQLSLLAQYDTGSAGFAGALLDGPMDVRISPDGAHLYVASRNDDAIAIFGRNPATGLLTFVGNEQNGVQGDPAASGPTAGLDGARRLLLSPDGQFLYAAGTAGNAVAVFARDPGTGGLRFIEAEINGQDDPADPAGVVEAMGQPVGLALSADGRQLYVASRFGDALQVFARETDAASADHGRLAFDTAYVSGLSGITDLDGAYGVAVSADDRHLYVSVEDDDALVLFDRAPDGSLTQRSTWRHDPIALPGLRGTQGLAISPDGLEVFATGLSDHSLTIMERMQTGNPEGLPFGDLRLRQTVFDDAGAVLHMAGPTAVVPSEDNRYLYVVANEDDAIVVFRRISLDEVFNNGFE